MDFNDWSDYRVMYQYLDEDGESHFEFTTVLSTGPQQAELDFTTASHWATQTGFKVVQVVEANDASTGYTELERQAARMQPELELDEESKAILKEATNG